jgi:hypothetical protein
LVARKVPGQITRQEWAFVSFKGPQPDELGSVKMNKRLPDRALSDRKALAKLFIAQAGRGRHEIVVNPGSMLMEALDQFDGIHEVPRIAKLPIDWANR